MDFFKPFGYEPERFAQPLLKRRMQLFIDSLAHFFEFSGVVGLEFTDLVFQCLADFGHAFRVRFSQGRQCLVQRVSETFHGI